MRSRSTRALTLLGAALTAACSSAASEDAPAGAIDTAAGEAVAITRSCRDPAAVRPAERRDVRTFDGVSYARQGGRELRLDIARPATDSVAPLVILLHGGSWSGGSRGSLREEMLTWARRGYVAATVEYRLTARGRNLFPASVADVRCAVRFLRARAARYGIDSTRIAAVGYSAGAHLASMLGTASDVRELDQPCGSDGRSAEEGSVQAVVSYAGPQDLRVNGPYTGDQAEIVTNFLGVFPGDEPARAALASPIVHVSAGDPPFLFVHGARDELVPIDHSRRMAAALRRVGTPATVLELRRVGHDFVGLGTSRDAAVRCTTDAFLARWLGGGR